MALAYLLARIGVKYFKALLWERVIDEEIVDVRLKARVKVKLATESDLAGSPLFRKDSGKISEENMCFIAIEGESIVGYVWFNIGVEAYVSELERKIRLKPGEGYVYAAFVLPAFRRKGIFKCLMQEVLLAAKSRNLEKLYVVTLTANIPSQRAFRLVGFRPIKLVSFIKIFFWRKYNEVDL